MAKRIETLSDFNNSVLEMMPLRMNSSQFVLNGKFSHIKFPMYKTDMIPEDLLISIFGNNYQKLEINYPKLKDYLNRHVPAWRNAISADR